MIALAYTPTRIYNTTEKKPTERKQRHWRQYASGISPRKPLRSNKSAIKDINNIIDIMEDLYGETAFEDGL